jgi:hypothetical protein
MMGHQRVVLLFLLNLSVAPGNRQQTVLMKIKEHRGISSQGAASTGPLRDGVELPPFQIHVEILNKAEVMASKVGNWWGISYAADFMVSEEAFATKISDKLCESIPAAVTESAGIDLSMVENKAEKHGTRFVLDTQVIGYDMKALGEKALNLDSEGSSTFSNIINNTLYGALSKMGMSEKFLEIHDKIANKIRNKIMEKMLEILPEKLGEEGVKIKIGIPEYQSSLQTANAAEAAAEAAAAEQAESVKAMIGLGQPFDTKCVIENRSALLDDAIEPGFFSWGKKWIASMISDAKFNKLIEKKLEEKVPPALQEKAGIESSCERLEGDEKSGIRFRMTVLGFNIHNLLTMAMTKKATAEGFELEMAEKKGREFVEGYDEALSSLKALADLGLKGMEEKMDIISAKVSGTVCEKVREMLKQTLEEKLYAKCESE